jgi:hypothetical protein
LLSLAWDDFRRILRYSPVGSIIPRRTAFITNAPIALLLCGLPIFPTMCSRMSSPINVSMGTLLIRLMARSFHSPVFSATCVRASSLAVSPLLGGFQSNRSVIICYCWFVRCVPATGWLHLAGHWHSLCPLFLTCGRRRITHLQCARLPPPSIPSASAPQQALFASLAGVVCRWGFSLKGGAVECSNRLPTPIHACAAPLPLGS